MIFKLYVIYLIINSFSLQNPTLITLNSQQNFFKYQLKKQQNFKINTMNPIFQKIKSLRYQIFSLFQPSEIFDENDGEDIENAYKTTNEHLLKVTQDSNILTIHYEPEYSSTVSHLIFSACLFDPINIDKYIQIIVHDQTLIRDFTQTVNSNKLSLQFTTMILISLIITFITRGKLNAPLYLITRHSILN